MKRFLLITLLSLLVAPLYAQDEKMYSWDYYLHDVRFGWGIFMPFLSDRYFDIMDDQDSHSSTIFDDYVGSQYYCGKKYNLGGVNIDYSYRFSKRFDIGVALTFNAESQKEYDMANDQFLRDRKGYFIGLAPTLRMYWIDQRMIRLYTAASIGAGVIFTKRMVSESKVIFNGQFTLAGASFGNRLFGYTELSIGTMGIVKVGAGYRF